MDRPENDPLPRLRFTPASSYHSSFFLLKLELSINNEPVAVDFTSGELTLKCRSPELSVPFPAIYSNVEEILQKYAVDHVSNFYCGDAPLFQTGFTSEYNLAKFLCWNSKLEAELTSLFSTAVSEIQAEASPIFPSKPVPMSVQTELFLVSPDEDNKVIPVSVENCSICMTLWKESEMFDFSSLFQAYYNRLDPSKLPRADAINLSALVKELKGMMDWPLFGMYLEVPEHELLEIEHKHANSRDIKACKRDLFTTWLRSQEQPTWSPVVRALVGMGLQPLAKQLGTKYGVPVPRAGEVKPPLDLYESEQIDPTVRKKARRDVEEASAKIVAMDETLSQFSTSLDQERSAREALASEFQMTRGDLSSRVRELEKLCQQRKQEEKTLEEMERELFSLQQQNKEAKESNEELKAIIRKKEEEIRKLRESVNKLKGEISSAEHDIQNLRETLREKTRQLEEKNDRIKEIEGRKNKLASELNVQKREMHRQMQLAMSADAKARFAEAQLESAKAQCEAAESRAKSHQRALTDKDQEIGRLSERLQTLESRLLQEQSSVSEEEMEVDKLEMELSGLKVQLAKAKSEREVMSGRMEVDLGCQQNIRDFQEALENDIISSKLEAKKLVEEERQERARIESMATALRPVIQEARDKSAQLQQEEQDLQAYEAQIVANKDFEYHITVTKQRMINLPSYTHTMNCLTCNYTCHYPCPFPNNDDKYRCVAIRNGYCTVCPGRCHWRRHVSQQYRFEFYEERETRVSAELRQKYDQATSNKTRAEHMISTLKSEQLRLESTVIESLRSIQHSLRRLNEIVQGYNPTRGVECIDFMVKVEAEKQSSGWMERVQYLQELRNKL